MKGKHYAFKKTPTGQYFPDKAVYYKRTETLKNNEFLPGWMFNFISIHSFSKDLEWLNYSLVSPLFIVEQGDGQRPDFEKECFQTKKAALERAKELALKHKCHIVFCG